MGNVQDYEKKLTQLEKKKNGVERQIRTIEQKRNEAKKKLENYKEENQRALNGVFHRLLNSKSRQEVLSQVATQEKGIAKLESELAYLRGERKEVKTRIDLLENYHLHGNNAHVKRFISSFDKKLKERQFARGGYNSYNDLWEQAKWLQEINHSDAARYEAIVCWCAYKEFRAPKHEQKAAFERACELGFPQSVAAGYCKSYYVHQEPVSSSAERDILMPRIDVSDM